MVGFSETWLKNGDDVEFRNYVSFSKGRLTRGRRGRWPGGVALTCRSELKNHLTGININLEGVIGVILAMGVSI